MKCQLCDGKGEYMHAIGGYRPCEYCNGTGEVEVVGDSVTDVCDKCGGTGDTINNIPPINEDWFCRLSTEEKAKFLKEISFCCNTCSPEQFEAYKNGKFKCPLKMACATANGFEDWLKEKHE